MSDRLAPKPIPRRDWLGLTGLWAAGFAIFSSMVGMARLPKPRVTPEASSIFRIGSPTELPVGSEKVIADINMRVISTPQGIAAMSLICTHLGCIVQPSTQGFVCPCHGSKFDRDGNVKGGPAPRPLMWNQVSQAASGELIVDTSVEVEAGQFYQIV
ncbi:MAG: Rieske 2Fe-2S domain-containing protein [Candidatus Hinthialibacter antarcticus]|nr:Rieske 2Fe-2S domain-containing protein [Candidatus Hinthialibacter antarcticus]